MQFVFDNQVKVPLSFTDMWHDREVFLVDLKTEANKRFAGLE